MINYLKEIIKFFLYGLVFLIISNIFFPQKTVRVSNVIQKNIPQFKKMGDLSNFSSISSPISLKIKEVLQNFEKYKKETVSLEGVLTMGCGGDSYRLSSKQGYIVYLTKLPNEKSRAYNSGGTARYRVIGKLGKIPFCGPSYCREPCSSMKYATNRKNEIVIKPTQMTKTEIFNTRKGEWERVK